MISLLPNTEDYQKFGRKTKLLIHPDNIPGMIISLPSRKETRRMGKEGENSENYLILHEESVVPKNNTVNDEMLNCIDYSTAQRESRGKSKNSVQNETLKYVNVSLISAPCQVPGKVAIAQSTDVVRTNFSKEEVGIGWSKLTKILSKKLVIKGNENSGFSFFL